MPMRTRRAVTETPSELSKSPTPAPEPSPITRKTKKDGLKFTVDLAMKLIAATRQVRPFAAGYRKVGEAWDEVAALVTEAAKIEPAMSRKTAKDKVDSLVKLHRVSSNSSFLHVALC